MITAAEKAKDPARTLMNKVIDLLFTKEELAQCGGMGSREKRDKEGKAIKVMVLDTLKLDAAIGRKEILMYMFWSEPLSYRSTL